MELKEEHKKVIFKLSDLGWMRDFYEECQEKGYRSTALMMAEEIKILEEKEKKNDQRNIA